MATMSARERRLVALAVVVALVVVGWLFLVEPIRGRNRTTAELLPAREQVLAKRRALIARGPSLKQELEETTKHLQEVQPRLLAAAAPPVAASELVKIVKDAAVQARLEVRSERILTPVPRGELLEIPIEITVSGGIRELVTMLYGLDDVRKILTLQDVKIRVLNVSQPRELLTTVMVSGFILPKPAALRQTVSPKPS